MMYRNAEKSTINCFILDNGGGICPVQKGLSLNHLAKLNWENRGLIIESESVLKCDFGPPSFFLKFVVIVIKLMNRKKKSKSISCIFHILYFQNIVRNFNNVFISMICTWYNTIIIHFMVALAISCYIMKGEITLGLNNKDNE